jgi:hypothetical protein
VLRRKSSWGGELWSTQYSPTNYINLRIENCQYSLSRNKINTPLKGIKLNKLFKSIDKNPGDWFGLCYEIFGANARSGYYQLEG